MTVGGAGETVEWAVKMRELPQERMLDALLATGEVTADDVRGIARRIAEFRVMAETSAAITARGGRAGSPRRANRVGERGAASHKT